MDRRNTNARTPDELRRLAHDMERRSVRLDGAERERMMQRVRDLRADADAWDREIAAEAERKSAHRRAAIHATKTRKAEFTAQYGSGKEKEQAEHFLARRWGR